LRKIKINVSSPNISLDVRVRMLRIYIGSYKIRTSGDSAYIHIPTKLALQLSTRKVKVIMQVISGGCNDATLHGSVMIFPATLTQVGETFRLKIPKKFLLLAKRIKECGTVDVWLEPRSENWKNRKAFYYGDPRET